MISHYKYHKYIIAFVCVKHPSIRIYANLMYIFGSNNVNINEFSILTVPCL